MSSSSAWLVEQPGDFRLIQWQAGACVNLAAMGQFWDSAVNNLE
jgi:hypothetical protein